MFFYCCGTKKNFISRHIVLFVWVMIMGIESTIGKQAKKICKQKQNTLLLIRNFDLPVYVYEFNFVLPLEAESITRFGKKRKREVHILLKQAWAN